LNDDIVDDAENANSDAEKNSGSDVSQIPLFVIKIGFSRLLNQHECLGVSSV
jgi:hypothetical protein